MSKSRREAAQRKRAARKQPDGHYTAIHNSVLTDPALSPIAFRVVLYLASKPDSWVLRTPDIMSNCGLTKYAVERVARPELSDAGYLETTIIRDDSGQVIGQETRLARSLVVYLGNGKTPRQDQTAGFQPSGSSAVWAETREDLDNTDVSPAQNQTAGIPQCGKPTPIVTTHRVVTTEYLSISDPPASPDAGGPVPPWFPGPPAEYPEWARANARRQMIKRPA